MDLCGDSASAIVSAMLRVESILRVCWLNLSGKKVFAILFCASSHAGCNWGMTAVGFEPTPLRTGA